MGPIKPNPADYKKSILRLQELDAIVAELTQELGKDLKVSTNPPEFLKSKIHTPISRGPQYVPTASYLNELSVPQARGILQEAIAEREIARAAAILNAPPPLQAPTSPAPSVLPGVPPQMSRVLNSLGPIGLFLELLTTSSELNKKEQETLGQRRQLPPTITE
jgi:hypothetical protein